MKAAPRRPPRTPRPERWLAIAAVGAGTFTLVTSELLPVGLLTHIGDDLGASDGTTGSLVLVPGLVAAGSAPLAARLSSRVDHRTLLCWCIAALAAANLMSAIATDLAVLLTARVVVGCSIGGFWTLAGGLGTRLARADRLGTATAVIFGGVAAASVAGVPLATVVGDALGWRIGFALVGACAVAVLIGLMRWLPALPPARRRTGVLAALHIPAVRVGVIATFFLVAGHFTAHTYVSPLLQSLTGISEGTIGPLLIAFGTAGLVANVVIARRAPARPGATLGVVASLLAAVLLALPAFTSGGRTALATMVIWGLAFGGVSVACQTWMIRSAPDAIEGATASMVAAFNLAIAAGALLGGVVVDRLAVHNVSWTGGALAAVAFTAVLHGTRSARRRSLNTIEATPERKDP